MLRCFFVWGYMLEFCFHFCAAKLQQKNDIRKQIVLFCFFLALETSYCTFWLAVFFCASKRCCHQALRSGSESSVFAIVYKKRPIQSGTTEERKTDLLLFRAGRNSTPKRELYPGGRIRPWLRCSRRRRGHRLPRCGGRAF